MKKHRVGIAGYGWAATAHIPAINASPLAQVTTICSSRALDAKALSAQHGCELRTCTSYDAMLRDPAVDVVSICSYHAQHAKQVIAAAEKVLRDQGMEVIAALVESDNPASLALFQQAGYTEIEPGIHYLAKRESDEA